MNNLASGGLALLGLILAAGTLRTEVRPTLPGFLAEPVPVSEGVLPPMEAGKLLSGPLSFQGKRVFVEPRNSGGIRFSDGTYLLAAVVDTSGHASGADEDYHAYLRTEVSLDLRGHKLKPGAYDIGLDDHHRFTVRGATRPIFAVNTSRDISLSRPLPLQIRRGSPAQGYRLYLGRDYVLISRADWLSASHGH